MLSTRGAREKALPCCASTHPHNWSVVLVFTSREKLHPAPPNQHRYPVIQALLELAARLDVTTAEGATGQRHAHAAIRLRAETGTRRGVVNAHNEVTPLTFHWDRPPAVVDVDVGHDPDEPSFYCDLPTALGWSSGFLNDGIPLGLSCGHGNSIRPLRLFYFWVTLAAGDRDPRLCGRHGCSASRIDPAPGRRSRYARAAWPGGNHVWRG